MKKLCLLVSFFLSLVPFVHAQFSIQSQTCFGDTGDDGAKRIITTRDGGYIFAGWVGGGSGEVSGYKGNQDAWVVKVNSSNAIEWQRCIGGDTLDVAYDIAQTEDGGFVVSGGTNSNDGDFANDNHGGLDAFAVKLDSLGNVEWANTYGGSNDEEGYRIYPVAGGKYIMIGYTFSDDQEINLNHTGRAWVVELDSKGNMVWNQTYGGSQDDELYGMAIDGAGQYIFAGYTTSADGEVTGNHGEGDLWMIKTDTTGALLQQKCFGGTGFDEANEMTALPSGNLVISGLTFSTDGDVSGNHGGGDAWVIEIDTSFNLKWQKCVGGSQYDVLNDITSFNGSLIADGITESTDGDFSGLNHGTDFSDDIAFVNLDTSGNVLVKQCYGGTGSDDGFGIYVNNNDIYIAGAAGSNDGDVSGNHGGLEDAWVLHLGTATGINGVNAFSKLTLFPNPSDGNFQLNFNAVKAMDASLTITNLLGERITNENVRVNEGDNSFSFSRNNMVSGIYFLTIVSGLSEWTGKVVIK